jgi:hypothetical protein
MTVITDKYVSHDRLIVDCYSPATGFLYFSRRLIELASSELHLNSGRFMGYDSNVGTHPMTFTTNSLEVAFSNCLHWLYENNRDTWNFDVRFNNYSEKVLAPDRTQDVFNYVFYFTAATDAVKFKLNLTND